MDAFIEQIKNGPITGQALFVMATGLLGVFIVLTAFYLIIKLLMRVMKPKKKEA
jgi:hypothetical protein